MAQLTRARAALDSPVVSNDVAYGTRLTLPAADLTTAGFQVNDDVLVLFFGQFEQAGGTTLQQWRLQYNGATITSGVADPRLDQWPEGAGEGRCVNYPPIRVDLGGTIGDFTLQTLRAGTSANTEVNYARIIVLRLADFGTENTDWRFNQSTTDVAHTTTYSGTNRASITWTPGQVEDWVALWGIHTAIDTATQNQEARLMLDTGTLVSGDWSTEGWDTTEELSYGSFVLLSALSVASHNLTVESRDDGTAANNHRNSSIFLFRKDLFTDIFYTAPGTVAATTSGTQVATLTDSLSANMDALVMGYGRIDVPTAQTGMLLTADNNEVAMIAQAELVNTALSNDATDEAPTWFMELEAFVSGALNVDMDVVAFDDANILDCRLLFWGMELAGGGGVALVEVEGEVTNQSESVLRARALARVHAEATSQSEVVLRARSMVRVLAEGISLSEQNLTVRSLLRLASEGIQIGETTIATRGRLEVVNEDSNVDEVVLKVTGLIRVLAEPLNVSEEATSFKGLVRLVAENLDISEQDLLYRALIRVLSETQDISEQVLKFQALTRTLNETVNIPETDLLTRALVRVLGEEVDLSEISLHIGGIIREISENLSISETSEVYRGIFRVIDESLDVSESDLFFLIGAGLVHVISEDLSISEADLRFMALVREVSEVLGLSEQDLRIRSLTRVLSESEAMSEVVVRVQALLRTLSEDMEISETDSWVRGIFKVIIEEVQLAEGVISKLAAAITGVLKGWRTFAPKNRDLGGDRTYDPKDRDYTKGPRDHSN